MFGQSNFLSFSLLTPVPGARAMRRAESTPPDEFLEFNTFYLNLGDALPPLAPNAYFTYAKDESLHQVVHDIHTHLGAAASLEGVGLWIRPPPPPPLPVDAAMDFEESDSEESEAAAEPVVQEPAAASANATGVPAMPTSPARLLELPPALQSQLETQLNRALAQAATYYTGQEHMTPDAALTQVRGQAMSLLLDITPASLQQFCREGASSSSTGQL